MPPAESPHRIGLVGLGAIATKAHLPAIAADPAFQLVAAASLAGEAPAGVALYRDHRALLARDDIDAVVIMTPPGPRFGIAADALAAGKHVMLEKPPTATCGALDHLAGLAEAHKRVLLTAWHSQFNPAIELARARIGGRALAWLRIDWKEDVEKYHPGQDWIWRAGGFGVFDAGINGLSILTDLLARPAIVTGARLTVRDGADVPIAAEVTFTDADSAAMTGVFDWSWKGPDTREVHGATVDGETFALTASGGRLEMGGAVLHDAPRREYPMIYRHFDALLRAGRSDVDAAPLRLVADIMLAGARG